jgi:hypothetical protein
MPIFKRDKAIVLEYILFTHEVSESNSHYRVDHHLVKHGGNMYLPKISNKFKRLPKQEIEFYHIETANYNTDWFIANNCLVETFTNGETKPNLIERMRRLELIKYNNNKLRMNW